MRCNPHFSQACRKKPLILIAAGQSRNNSFCTQARQIHGYVGRAACLFLVFGTPYHRHRSFRRNAPHIAPDVLVEHDIANHQKPLACPLMFNIMYDLVQFSNHGAAPLTRCGLQPLHSPEARIIVAIIAG